MKTNITSSKRIRCPTICKVINSELETDMFRTVKFVRRTKSFPSNLMEYLGDCAARRISIISESSHSSQTTSSSGEKKSLLYRDLSAKILACGPITVADYMKEVLTHPTAGYYMNRDVFGKDGDFTTSPEITQLFGEMIGIWVVNELSKITRDPFQLVELGPGRGTLSRDLLRVFKQLKVIDKVSLHMVEISPALSAVQARNLCSSSEEVSQAANTEENSVGHYRQGITEDGVQVFWYYCVKDIPKKFSVFLAHEFFDALPIHKFQKTNETWNEVLVDVDQSSVDEERFRYVVTRTSTPASKIFVAHDERRNHVEVSPQTMVITEYLSSFISEYGGFALIADYGHNGEKTDTFRAFRRHRQHDPLVDPGTADLTADVDFSLIKRIAQGQNRLVAFGPVDQRIFLKELGIDVRLSMLLKNATTEQRKDIESGYHMIMDEDKMGNCFKVLSLFPSVLREHLTRWPVAGFGSEADQEASK